MVLSVQYWLYKIKVKILIDSKLSKTYHINQECFGNFAEIRFAKLFGKPVTFKCFPYSLN